MLTRTETGRWKIVAHLHDWLKEYRMYHRKDGMLVKERDDAIGASRYAMMDLGFATLPTPDRPLMRRELPREPVMGI